MMTPRKTIFFLALALLSGLSCVAQLQDYELDKTTFVTAEAAADNKRNAGKVPGVYVGFADGFNDEEGRSRVADALRQGAKLLLLFRHGQAAHNDVENHTVLWRKAKAFGIGNKITEDDGFGREIRHEIFDPPLVDKGFSDAETLHRVAEPWFKWIKSAEDEFGVSYVTSPLARAVQTATIVDEGIVWTLDERVREAVSTLGSDLRDDLSKLMINHKNLRYDMYEEEVSDDVAAMPMPEKPVMFADSDPYVNQLTFEDIGARVNRWLKRISESNERIHVVSSHGIFLSQVLHLVGFGNYRLTNCELVPVLLLPLQH